MSTDRNMIIDSDAFLEDFGEFDKKIGKVEETLYQIDNLMKQIDGENELWKCENAVLVSDSYSKLAETFKKINAELNVYSIFLKETQEEYVTEENKQEKSIEKYSEELSIN